MAENTIIHEISLAGYKATSTGGMLDLGTWGSYGIEKLHLTLDAAWQDLTITAFFNVKGEVVAKKVVGKDGYADVPWEATKENTFAGRIVFEGSINGQRRISANLNYKVTNHSETTDNDPVPTADRWNQFVTENKEYRDGAFEAAERANARAEDAEAASDDAQAAARAAKASETAAAESASNAAASATKATQEAGAAAGSATAAKESVAAAAASATKAGQSAGTATEKANAAESARADAESASASAAASAKRSEDAAKTAEDAATKVINEGVAEKLTEMQGIQEDVKARQQDVTEKQADVTANVELARQAALSNGYMQMGVDPDTGHLMYTRTTNLKDKIDFAIVNDTNLEVQIHG